jgi:hypothetical protein
MPCGRHDVVASRHGSLDVATHIANGSVMMSACALGRRCAVAAIVGLMAMCASAGTFVQPTCSGTTPSGLQWSAVATGTALPIRTTGTNPLNGSPGAVVYFDTTTGQMQFDPRGLRISTFNVTYTTGTANISGTTPGPFQYTTGTGLNAYSDIAGTERTFPARDLGTSGFPPTTLPSRVALVVGTLAANLNIGTNPNSASSDGTWNVAWGFPTNLIRSGSVATMALCFTGTGHNYFRTITEGGNLNANVLGFGKQQGVFSYTIYGVSGTQVGAVVPVPEPSMVASTLAGLVFGSFSAWRRRRAGCHAAAPIHDDGSRA